MSLLRRPSATLGALVGVGSMAALLVVIVARESRLGFGPLGDVMAAGARILIAAALLWAGAAVLFHLARRSRGGGRGLLILAIGAVAVQCVLVIGMLLPTPATRILAGVGLFLGAWVGGAAGAWARALWTGRIRTAGEEGTEREGVGQARTRRTALLPALNLSAALLLSTAVCAWLFLSPSPTRTLGASSEMGPRPALLPGPDPAGQGPYPVLSFAYGSGRDLRRPEYTDSILFRSPSVDLAPLLPGLAPSDARVHREHWGFGLDSIPLNARVWLPQLPEGPLRDPALPEAPFPLVLIVPGIDPDSERSELGYGYLAELLASRGMVVVAVDVNFLAGPRIAARAAEMPVRGWLALEHLRLLAEWKEFDPEGIPALFDMDRIGLVGHSRGGEAVALAAMLNQLGRYPDNASIPLSFGFGIRAVVAYAPTDRYYRPTGRSVALNDVSYLVLHGSQDGDLVSFAGTGQYQRTHFSSSPPEGLPRPFRASVYIEGANHANFSSRRSGSDHPGIVGRLVDRRALLPPEEQRRATSVFTLAFLEAALRGDDALVGILRDPRAAGDWLPSTGFVTRFDDGRSVRLADFEGDLDPGSGSLPGVRLEGRNLTYWREEGLRLRDAERSPQETTVVRLGWDRTRETRGEPAFEVHLPGPGSDGEGGIPAVEALLTSSTQLVFSLGSPSPQAGAPDLSVEVESRSGQRVRLPLSFLGPTPQPIEPRLWRLPFLDAMQTRGPEQLLQDFHVPLAVFELAGPGLDAREISVVRFVFDRASSGTVLLDDVGLLVSESPPPGGGRATPPAP